MAKTREREITAGDSSLLLRVAATLIVVILVAVPFQGLWSVMASFSPAPLAFKAWKEVLLALVAICTIIWLIGSGRTRVKGLFSQWSIILAVTYSLFHLLLLGIGQTGIEATLAGLVIDTRFSVFFVVVYAIALGCDWLVRLAYRASFCSLLIVSGFGVLQQYLLPADILVGLGYDKNTTIAPFLTVDQNPAFVRIISTLRGPNPLGAYMVIGMSFAVSWLRLEAHKYKTAIWKMVVSGLMMTSVLYATYSRSAQLAAAIAVGLVLYATRKKLSLTILVGVAIGMAALGGAYLLVKDHPTIQTIVEHKDPHDSAGNDSNEGHIESLVHGFERMVEQPLGGGVGSTGSASLLGDSPQIIENQYLFIAHESGWIGLLLFVGLQCVVLCQLYQRRNQWQAVALFSSGVGMVIIGMLLPVFADDTIAYVWWGLSALCLATQGTQKKRGNQHGSTDTAN